MCSRIVLKLATLFILINFVTWYRGQLLVHCRYDSAKVCVLPLLLEKRSFCGIQGLSNVVSIHSQGQILLSFGYEDN